MQPRARGSDGGSFRRDLLALSLLACLLLSPLPCPAQNAPFAIVFLHEPLFPVVPNHGLDRHKEERDRLHRLFLEMGVRLVVSGHDHIYDRSDRSGITYVIAGATGGMLPSFARDGDPFRYMVVTRKDGVYSFITRDMAGVVRDEFLIGGNASDQRLSNQAPRRAVHP